MQPTFTEWNDVKVRLSERKSKFIWGFILPTPWSMTAGSEREYLRLKAKSSANRTQYTIWLIIKSSELIYFYCWDAAYLYGMKWRKVSEKFTQTSEITLLIFVFSGLCWKPWMPFFEFFPYFCRREPFPFSLSVSLQVIHADFYLGNPLVQFFSVFRIKGHTFYLPFHSFIVVAKIKIYFIPSKFSTIFLAPLPKQGIYGAVRAMLSLLGHCRVVT